MNNNLVAYVHELPEEHPARRQFNELVTVAMTQAAELQECYNALGAQGAVAVRLARAVRWALGFPEGEPVFEERKPGQRVYHWRRELHRRSGLDAAGEINIEEEMKNYEQLTSNDIPADAVADGLPAVPFSGVQPEHRPGRELPTAEAAQLAGADGSSPAG